MLDPEDRLTPRERTKLVLSDIEKVLQMYDPDYVPFHWTPQVEKKSPQP